MPFIQVFRAMRIVVLADEQQRRELSANMQANDSVQWVASHEQLGGRTDIKVLIDLLFINEKERIAQLAGAAQVVVVNSVADTLADIHSSFVRINAWDSFLISTFIEASTNEADKSKVEEVFAVFGKKLQWLPDQPGFVTARVVSMIINEAYLALGEGISTKEEIDTAMKLGTAYPFGPFEWAEKIGVQNVVNLLQKLALQDPKYIPAELLAQPIQL